MEEPRVDTRSIDLESLKGLAHPLRVQIFDVLSTYGSFTASGLAERLGESSGATSYHLRQLEKHGFVREVAGKGTGRERWWERVPGAVELSPAHMDDSAGARAASDIVLRQWRQNRELLLTEFVEHGYDLLPKDWVGVTAVTTMNLRLTRDQLAEIVRQFFLFSREFIEKYRGLDDPGSRPVQIHFNAFPVVDGVETPMNNAPTERTPTAMASTAQTPTEDTES